MPKKNEGPTKSKATGYYYIDTHIGFFPDIKRFRYSLKTKRRELAVQLWKKEHRKLWATYYRFTLSEKPHADWHLFHPHKKPRAKQSKEEKIEESKKKISIKNSGEYHPQWRGGISFEPYGVEFNDTLKERVRKRDKNTCVACRKPEGEKSHTVHHIDYNKENNNPINLITLCASCHALTNANREVWVAFFRSFCEIRSLQKKAKKLSA